MGSLKVHLARNEAVWSDPEPSSQEANCYKLLDLRQAGGHQLFLLKLVPVMPWGPGCIWQQSPSPWNCLKLRIYCGYSSNWDLPRWLKTSRMKCTGTGKNWRYVSSFLSPDSQSYILELSWVFYFSLNKGVWNILISQNRLSSLQCAAASF